MRDRRRIIHFNIVPGLAWVFLGIAVAKRDWFYLVLAILLFTINYLKTGGVFSQEDEQ